MEATNGNFSCNHCERQYTTLRALKKHLQSHFFTFTCNDCGKQFTRQDYLIEHMSCHTNEKPFECYHCKAKFPRRRYVYLHMKKVHGFVPTAADKKKLLASTKHFNSNFKKRVLNGNVSYFRTKTDISSKVDFKKDTTHNDLPCDNAEHVETDQTTTDLLTEDLKPELNENNYKMIGRPISPCIICRQLLNLLKHHLNMEHSFCHQEKNLTSNNMQCEFEQYEREVLKMFLREDRGLNVNVDSVFHNNSISTRISGYEEDQSYSCGVESKTYDQGENSVTKPEILELARNDTDSTDAQGISFKHGRPPVYKMSNSNLISNLNVGNCQFKDIKTESNFETKLKNKGKPLQRKPFNCKKCKIGLSCTSYIIHKARHFKEEKIQKSKNNLLQKVSADKNQLKDSKNKQIKLFPKQCEVCKKNMTSYKEWRYHVVRLHSAPKVVCDICGKTFKQKGQYNIHRLKHFAPSFECNFCGQKLRYQQHYEEHLRIHTGEKPYKCHMCDKTFRSANFRARHMVVHKSVTPYNCSVCNKGYKRKNGLLKHLSSKAHKILV